MKFRFMRVAFLMAVAVSLAIPCVGAEALLQFGNIHNAYFPDRFPTNISKQNEDNFIQGSPPSVWHGIEGDVVSIPFTLSSFTAQKIDVGVRILYQNTDVTEQAQPQLLRALNVRVEGNSNGNCSCAARKLPVSNGASQVTCADVAVDSQTPRACPTRLQRNKIASTLVRAAPFYIKDPLLPIGTDRAEVSIHPRTAELFLVDVRIRPSLPKGMLDVRVTATESDGSKHTITVPLKVLKLRLVGFPGVDVSFWLSEDPRDLGTKPTYTSINGKWGGEWWSDEHWKNLEHAAEALSRIGATSAMVPLFVRNPFGLDATSLIRIKCFSSTAGSASLQGEETTLALGSETTGLKYSFDFSNFHRWISVFRRAGFRQFEGAPLMANGGQLPLVLECDVLQKGRSEATIRQFRFMPRAGSGNEVHERELIYREKFLASFLPALKLELDKAGIAKNYVQHVIDENAPTDNALEAYSRVNALVRKHMPGIRTIDALNQYNAPKYRSLVDVPVVHLALLYDDQMNRSSIRREVSDAFHGRKYFYNTALREGGPNRFIDTNPMESRAYGWMLLELGYDGMLYWAANSFRYPSARNLDNLRRPSDWSPYEYSIGPLPGGSVEPGLAAGSNWIFYPGPEGLIDSIRGRRLRDGLLDHWLYLSAWRKCSGEKSCTERLLGVRQRLTGKNQDAADFSRDPAEYQTAREVMMDILER